MKCRKLYNENFNGFVYMNQFMSLKQSDDLAKLTEELIITKSNRLSNQIEY
jgi:hypothetical protein